MYEIAVLEYRPRYSNPYDYLLALKKRALKSKVRRKRSSQIEFLKHNVYTRDMRILGIETSCDETAAAVVEDGGKF
jgi:hypothetical protein